MPARRTWPSVGGKADTVSEACDAGVLRRANRRFFVLIALATAVLFGGTLGYRYLTRGAAGWLDCLYMTVITVTTIGYGEILDPALYGPTMRAFNMLIAVTGIGIITYAISSITSFAVDGELRALWRRRTMQAHLNSLHGHFLIAGWGTSAPAIARELCRTGRNVVAILPHGGAEATTAGREGVETIVHGDPTDDERLLEAGILRAAGLFAASDDDQLNIIVSLSARRLNPTLRIVSAARDESNAVKMRRAGADATVSLSSIGGLRMASEMLRPTVVSFLDTMLRQSDPPLRVEEVLVGDAAIGRRLSDVAPAGRRNSLVLAVRHGDAWQFNPPGSHELGHGDVLIVMTTPEDLAAWRRELQGV